MLQKYQKLWIWFWLSSRKVFRYLFFPPKLFHSFFWGDFSQFYLPLFAFHSSITLHCYRQHRRQQTALLRTWSKKINPPKKKISRKEQIFVPFWEKKNFGCFSVEMFFINKFTYSKNINPILFFHSSHYFCLLL